MENEIVVIEIKPIYCDTCGHESCEYLSDVGIFEVYQCFICGRFRKIAVR